MLRITSLKATNGALQADSPLPADTLSNLMGKNGLMGQSVLLRPDWALRFLKVERRWERVWLTLVLCFGRSHLQFIA